MPRYAGKWPRLHEHGFICKRIVLYKVTPSVYTETMCNHALLKKKNASVQSVGFSKRWLHRVL